MSFKPLSSKIGASLTALALSASVAFAAVAPAEAAPLRLPAPVAAPAAGTTDVVPVQYRARRRAVRRAARRAYRRGLRDGRYRYRDSRVRRRNRAFVGGVVGGLALGAIVAGSRRGYAAPRYYAPRFTPAHHGWCSHRYRSYRASDGTYQPYHGPRKLCRSPYL